MAKLLLIDGSNLLFQMFFGMPARIINKDGKAIQGTLGFVGALLKIIRMTEPTHIALIFDGEIHNGRTDINESYKANRPDYSQMEEEDSPFSQLPDIYKALDFLQLKYCETTVCETDDLIAGYAKKYSGELDIVISSYDSDFFQLISEKVTVLRYRGDSTQLCTPAYIEEKLGITPEKYADFKSLTGDSADNIKGACKVGPKTAAMLINEFGSLDALLSSTEMIKRPALRASIEEDKARLKDNLKLIKLDGVFPLPFPLDELKYQYNGITTTEVLKGIGVK